MGCACGNDGRWIDALCTFGKFLDQFVREDILSDAYGKGTAEGTEEDGQGVWRMLGLINMPD